MRTVLIRLEERQAKKWIAGKRLLGRPNLFYRRKSTVVEGQLMPVSKEHASARTSSGLDSSGLDMDGRLRLVFMASEVSVALLTRKRFLATPEIGSR